VALRNAPRVRPELILLEVMMPGIDGYEVCRRLKADAGTSAVPVIFITANNDAESLVKGFQAGGVDYVGKPFRDEEVLLRVRSQLTLYRLTQQLTSNNAAWKRPTLRSARRERAAPTS
jgi:PleD family two-component response regulator